MSNYTITISAAEDAALSFVAFSQQGWIEHAVKERCRLAIEEIVKITIEKCLATGTQIPSSKEDMVLLAFEQGWVKSAADRNAAFLAEIANAQGA